MGATHIWVRGKAALEICKRDSAGFECDLSPTHTLTTPLTQAPPVVRADLAAGELECGVHGPASGRSNAGAASY